MKDNNRINKYLFLMNLDCGKMMKAYLRMQSYESKLKNIKLHLCNIMIMMLLTTIVLLSTSCNSKSYVVTDDALDTNNNIILSGQILTREVERDYDKSKMNIQILKLDNPISIIYKSNFGYEDTVNNIEEVQIKYLNDKDISESHMEISGELKSGKNNSFGRDSYTDYVLITNYVK